MRNLILIAILTLVLSLSACGGGSPITIEPPDDHGHETGLCPGTGNYYQVSDCGNCHDH